MSIIRMPPVRCALVHRAVTPRQNDRGDTTIVVDMGPFLSVCLLLSDPFRLFFVGRAYGPTRLCPTLAMVMDAVYIASNQSSYQSALESSTVPPRVLILPTWPSFSTTDPAMSSVSPLITAIRGLVESLSKSNCRDNRQDPCGSTNKCCALIRCKSANSLVSWINASLFISHMT